MLASTFDKTMSPLVAACWSLSHDFYQQQSVPSFHGTLDVNSQQGQ